MLNNAAKYSDRTGHIWLAAECDAGDVVVSIKDAGIGIAHDKLSSIFEMFSQVNDSLERSQGGLGIGLTLVKWIIEMHGGKIEVKSDGVGKGTEFVVRLPVAVAASAIEANDRDPEPPAVAWMLRILIVNDNRDAAHSLAAMFRIIGNDTRTVYDGEEALVAGAPVINPT